MTVAELIAELQKLPQDLKVNYIPLREVEVLEDEDGRCCGSRYCDNCDNCENAP